VDIELCEDAGAACLRLPAASQTLMLDGSGSLTLRVDRTLAALSVFGQADGDSIRHGRVLVSRSGDADFAAFSASTRFSFVVADTVVTLSGPEPTATIEVVGDELILVYVYSAADLRGRTLTGSLKAMAAVDGASITSDIVVDESGGRGTITITLRRVAYPAPVERELVVSLGALAAGFVLGEPASIGTPFSFLPLPPTRLEARQAEGSEGRQGAAGSASIELGYSFEYAAGNRLDRPRAGLEVRCRLPRRR
jgi:hypothetical protein